MSTRRVKFVWGASKVIQGRWFLGVLGFYSRRGMPEDGLAISVRGALLWGAVLALLGWVAVATAGFWIWQRNPYTLLTYPDALLYPLRQAGITEKKGQAFIAQGLDLARAGRWYDAANLLRLGLARSPRDFRARLTLAEYYQMTNQRSLAMRTLTDGLGGDYPGRRLLEAVFKLATQGEDFETVTELSARFLPVVKREGPAADYRWLLERRYEALTAAGRHAEALALAETASAGDTNDERRVLSLLALGRTAEATTLLAEWRGRSGADLRLVARLEVRAFREARRYDDMERALAELRQRSPGDPGPLVYGVVQQALAGRDAAAAGALADFIFRFGGSVENLALVATPLAEIGNLTLLEQTAAAAREHGFPPARFQVLLMETHLGRGEWEAAGGILAALPPATGKNAEENAWREWVQLLIAAARSPVEGSQQAFVELLRGRPWTVRIFRQSVEAMTRAGRLETARDILELARRSQPASKWLQTKDDELQARLSAGAAARPAAPAGAKAGPPGAAETTFVQRLEYLLQAKKWAEAARHLAQLQGVVPAPDWLDRHEALIRLAQVRIAHAQRDVPGLTAAARQFLNGDVSRAMQLVELAREATASGDKVSAGLLAREVLRRHEEFAPARRLLTELTPAGEKKQ